MDCWIKTASFGIHSSKKSINPLNRPLFPMGFFAALKAGFHRVETIRFVVRFLRTMRQPNTRMIDMKKILLITGAAAALILTGCNQGGTSDQYGTSSGNEASSNSMNNAHTTSSNTPVTP